jgi:penicillin-binding protein activator
MIKKLTFLSITCFLLASCATSTVVNEKGSSSKYVDYSAVNTSSSVGIESNDIVSMTEKMVRSMLANRMLSGRAVSPRIQLDETLLKNKSTTRINKELITNRMRIYLNREANGRLIFVSRENIVAVEKERAMKSSGVVDGGTIRSTAATAGVDYRLVGTISGQDSLHSGDVRSKYHQITFEMIDMELGTVVWGDIFEFKKSAIEDAAYR